MSWAVSGLLFSLMKRSLDSERGKAGRGCRALDRHGKTDADEGAVVAGVEDAGDDTDHLALHGDQRPARIAGVGRRVELYQVADFLLALGRLEGPPEAGDHPGRGGRADAEREAHG